MDIKELLAKVKNNEIDTDEAEKLLKKLPYEDMGFAKIDHHRKFRQGHSEVIYCEGKKKEHLAEIFKALARENKRVLGTRASEEQYLYVREQIPDICYDESTRLIKYIKEDIPCIGNIAVCAAGTSDMPVAEEAAQTAEFFGSGVTRVYDIGIAGIHRLFANIDIINQASCIIAVAGMEGALPGIIAGLTDKPVIAVPTSVGYGSNFGGLSALLTMLNSCANGVTVVNIDNGYGAAYTADVINKLINRKEQR